MHASNALELFVCIKTTKAIDTENFPIHIKSRFFLCLWLKKKNNVDNFELKIHD